MADDLKETPSQTAGPYVHIGLTPNALGMNRPFESDLGAVMAGPQSEGTAIVLEGVVYDGAGEICRDVLVEAWQADALGRLGPADGANSDFSGWGRAACDLETGLYRFETIMPGPVVTDGRKGAPHIALWIVARGVNLGLHTRVYFPEDAALHVDDPVLLAAPDDRLHTLVATRHESNHYRFDIRLQGENETVFFDI